MKNEILVTRMNILGGMNSLVLETGDEDLFDWWFMNGLPDACTEDDLRYVAENDEEFAEVCQLFAKIMKVNSGE